MVSESCFNKEELVPMRNVLICIPSNTSLHKALAIHIDNNTIFRHLLLNQNDLFYTLDNKVSTGVKRALVHPGQLQLIFSGEDTV